MASALRVCGERLGLAWTHTARAESDTGLGLWLVVVSPVSSPVLICPGLLRQRRSCWARPCAGRNQTSSDVPAGLTQSVAGLQLDESFLCASAGL